MKEFGASTNTYTIEYPMAESEFEVQAFLFNELRCHGIDVRGEVSAYGCFGLRKEKAGCRFDLVIFDKSKKALQIVEVKARPVKHKKNGFQETRQGAKYPHFGVPVSVIYGMNDAREFLSKFTV